MSCPPWDVCRHCKTGFRTVTTVKECLAPEKPFDPLDIDKDAPYT
jgi:hypothetical protein